jgi:hypothetical protein
VDIVRQDASTLEQPFMPDVRVDSRFRAGSIALADGSRLHDTEASLLISDELLTIRDMTGYWRGAPVRVSGLARPPGPDGRPRQDVIVDAADVPIQRGGPVRSAAGQELGTIEFAGTGDVWANLTSTETGASESFVVHVKDGRIKGFDQQTTWRGVNGWVVASQNAQRIVCMNARSDRGEFSLSGVLPDQMNLSSPVELELAADDAEIERLLGGLVPACWLRVREALGLSGVGRIKAKCYRNADGQQASAPIQLSGRAGWETGDGWARLTVQAPETELTPAFVEAMPKALGDLLRRMTARGNVSIALDPIELVSSQRQEWKLHGRLRFRQGSMLLGVALEQLSGEISGSLSIDATGEITLGADISIDSGRLDGRPIERWLARMTGVPGDRRVKIEDLKGYSCGGVIVGDATIDPVSGEYELSMTLKDLSLAEFLNDDETKRNAPRPGRMDGRVFLRGKGEGSASRTGGGELRIRGGSLLASPATRKLVEASRQGNREVSGEVDRADLRFAWEADVLRFSRIDLVSKDLRLIGTGAWNLRDDGITMTLVGASGENAPRLAVISDLLESATQELLQYRVEGTIDNPRVTAEPMHNLTDPLRRLLRGE